MKKKLALLLVSFMLIYLTGCSVSGDYISAETASGLWEMFIVLPLAQFIELLYNLLGQNLGLAIIIATLISRFALFPIMNHSNNSAVRMQEMQPKMQEIQNKYKGKQDQESQIKMSQEMKELGFNPLAGCLPMLIPMPLLMAFFQAISRHPLIVAMDTSAYFLGMNLSTTMSIPNFIIGILIASLTFLSQHITTKRNSANHSQEGQVTNNPTMKVMNTFMPFLMFTMVISTPIAMGLHFLTATIFQCIQTLVFKRIHKSKNI